VALKVIRAGEHSSGEERRRFVAEARAAARLRHVHIVQVYELSESGGCPFFAMELVEGPSLLRRLDGTPWPARQAAALVETLARAMHYAHGQGIVHRDLKPANVLLTPDGQPKVTDFGLAKRLDGCNTGTHTATAGTPSYMAPEQAQGRAGRISPATDLYALGAILYELLTGRPPFKAATAVETAVQVLNEEPVRPGRLRPGLPRDLETVCLKCLEKDARKRFASAEELADDLSRYLEGKPVLARPVGFVGQGWRWCRRRPAVAGLLVGLASVLVSGFALFVVLFGQTVEAWSREEVARRKAEDRDRRTRHILAALVRPNRQMSFQTLEARRSRSLDQLKQAADLTEAFLREEPADVALQAVLADVYAGASFLQFDRWHHIAGLAISEKGLGLPEAAVGQYLSIADFQPQAAAEDTFGGSLLDHEHGQIVEALAYGERALDLMKRVVAAQPRNPEYRRSLAEVYHWNGLLHMHNVDPGRALSSFEHAFALRRALVDEQPEPDNRYNLAVVQQLVGESYYSVGRTAEAYRYVEAGRVLLSQLLAEQPGEKRYRGYLAQTYAWLGYAHDIAGSPDEAGRYRRQAYNLWKDWLRQRPGDTEARRAAGRLASRLIRGDAAEPYYTEAVWSYETACKSMERLLEDEPTNRWLREQLERLYRRLVLCHEKGSHPARRVEAWKRYTEFLGSLAEREPGDQGLGLDLGQAHADLADFCRAAGETQTAVRAAHRAFAILQACRPLGPPNSVAAERRFHWANRAWNVAHAIRRGGLWEKALVLADQSRLLLDELVRESPRNIPYSLGLRRACEEVGRAYIDLDRPDEALAAYLSSVEVMRRVIEQEPANLYYRQLLAGRCLNLSRHLRGEGRFSEAADWLLEREKLLPADAPYLRLVSQEFALLAREVGKDSPELTLAELAERQRYLRLSARTPSEIPSWVPPPVVTSERAGP
jgi:serine/threonine-protein kinase